MYYCTILLLFYCTSILLFYWTTRLLYCCTGAADSVLPLKYNITVLKRQATVLLYYSIYYTEAADYCTTVLPYYSITVLERHTTVLLCYHKKYSISVLKWQATVLLYYKSDRLMYYSGTAVHIQKSTH
jgi:hypothetical protein